MEKIDDILVEQELNETLNPQIDEENFLEQLSNYKNNESYQDTEIIFKNYVPIDSISFNVKKFTQFNQISKIEKSLYKNSKQAIKDFLNLEKNTIDIISKEKNADLKNKLNISLSKFNDKTENAILELIKENKNS